MDKVEHIGIAVKDLALSIPLFEKLLQTTCYKTEIIDADKVTTAFLKTGNTKIELVASPSHEGPIQKFLDQRGEGLHHIAFAVQDIEAEMQRLRNEGFILLDEKPRTGADNKMVCFLHPKSTGGVLVELCMDKPK
ncbi:MAG TPA: methylmalonyl-CoA epimerase [Puia sp.]|nr:methylmalonyl-CoA epimerase [Puia sp.]